jgi:hypothetical protein
MEDTIGGPVGVNEFSERGLVKEDTIEGHVGVI